MCVFRFWGGPRSIGQNKISTDDLVTRYEENQHYGEQEWDVEDTLMAVWDATRVDAMGKGLDPDSIKQPNRSSVESCNSQLMSIVGKTR